VKKLKKNKNSKVILYAAIAVVLIAALYLVNNPGALSNQAKAVDFSRANNPEYYSLLPAKPSDFAQVQLMWQQGIIRDDPERMNASYWKQPEWFPLYSENFVPTIETIVRENRLAVWSLGIFDSQIYNRINQDWLKNATTTPTTSGFGVLEIKGDSIVIRHRFWLRAAPGASKIYGVGIYPIYPGTSYLKGNDALGIPNETVQQDPALTESYMKISAVENETGATEFNMGTYFPQLSYDYVREIEVTTEIQKNTPKGLYVIGIDASGPSREYQEQQSLKYLLSYTDPSIGMFRGPSEFRLFIEVI
jgi:hypothetical protein